MYSLFEDFFVFSRLDLTNSRMKLILTVPTFKVHLPERKETCLHEYASANCLLKFQVTSAQRLAKIIDI